jgi:hypothetical protein
MHDKVSSQSDSPFKLGNITRDIGAHCIFKFVDGNEARVSRPLLIVAKLIRVIKCLRPLPGRLLVIKILFVVITIHLLH